MPVVAVLAAAAVPVFAADALLCLAVSFSYLQRTHRLLQMVGLPPASAAAVWSYECVCASELVERVLTLLMLFTNGLQHVKAQGKNG